MRGVISPCAAGPLNTHNAIPAAPIIPNTKSAINVRRSPCP